MLCVDLENRNENWCISCRCGEPLSTDYDFYRIFKNRNGFYSLYKAVCLIKKLQTDTEWKKDNKTAVDRNISYCLMDFHECAKKALGTIPIVKVRSENKNLVTAPGCGCMWSKSGIEEYIHRCCMCLDIWYHPNKDMDMHVFCPCGYPMYTELSFINPYCKKEGNQTLWQLYCQTCCVIGCLRDKQYMRVWEAFQNFIECVRNVK